MASSVIAHISIGTNNFEKARDFYNKVLSTLGITPLMDFPGAVGYGKLAADFWLQTPIDGKEATVGNGSHVAFVGASEEQVNEFYRMAIASGAVCDGAPGYRPMYSDAYYGCFVRDLDGHKIEAMFWDGSRLS